MELQVEGFFILHFCGYLFQRQLNVAVGLCSKIRWVNSHFPHCLGTDLVVPWISSKFLIRIVFLLLQDCSENELCCSFKTNKFCLASAFVACGPLHQMHSKMDYSSWKLMPNEICQPFGSNKAVGFPPTCLICLFSLHKSHTVPLMYLSLQLVRTLDSCGE